MREERYTVQRPVYETVMRDGSYNVVRNVSETSEREERYIVQRPVTETVMREERYCRAAARHRDDPADAVPHRDAAR